MVWSTNKHYSCNISLLPTTMLFCGNKYQQCRCFRGHCIPRWMFSACSELLHKSMYHSSANKIVVPSKSSWSLIGFVLSKIELKPATPRVDIVLFLKVYQCSGLPSNLSKSWAAILKETALEKYFSSSPLCLDTITNWRRRLWLLLVELAGCL